MNKRKHTSAFKVKVVLEALSERSTIQELGRKYDLHPSDHQLENPVLEKFSFGF